MRWWSRGIWLAASSVLGAAFVVAAAPSCATLLGMEEPEPLAAPDAGTGGNGGDHEAGGAGGAGGSECEHATWPLPPDGGATTSADEFVLAIRRIFSTDSSGQSVGWDLDNTCTCDTQGSSCVAPLAPLSLVDDCDFAEGRDNNFAKVLVPLGVFAGTADLLELFSSAAEQGEWSLLMRVQEYNGEPDDRQVRASWYLTHGSTATPPGWAGMDGWYVTESSVGPGADGGLDIDSPQYVDDNAYVAGNVLVASLPSVDFLLGASTMRFELRVTAGWITGELYREGALWKLRNGVLTGRIRLDDMFHILASYRETSGQLLCTDQAGYDLFKDYVCALPDILSSLGSVTNPCDAVSVAIGFEAEQAQLGAIVPPTPPPPGCPPETDPANDSCP